VYKPHLVIYMSCAGLYMYDIEQESLIFLKLIEVTKNIESEILLIEALSGIRWEDGYLEKI